jgi:predicted dehydrogenase
MKKPIKLGIVGLGRAGHGMHLEELAGKEDMFEICAVADLIDERCEEFKEKFGCKVYKSIEELVDDPEIEVVDIATRSCDHYKHAKTALDAGKTVFLEKPMSETYEQAKKLIELGEADGKRRLFIRHNRRFEAKFMHLNSIINSGILGDVFFIRRSVANFDHRTDWQTISQYGGGQLLNWGPHIVDQALRFSNVARGWSAAKELLLYVAHGMDHLSGADDLESADRARMRRRELAWMRDYARAGAEKGRR